jgi:hypothetical protein
MDFTWQRLEPCAYVTNKKVLVVRDTQGASHSRTDLTDGRIHGEIVQAPVFEAPGQTRVGRFG